MRKFYVAFILGAILFGAFSLIFLDYRCSRSVDDEGGCLWKRGIPFTFERGLGDVPPERSYGFLFLNFVFWIIAPGLIIWVYSRVKR